MVVLSYDSDGRIPSFNSKLDADIIIRFDTNWKLYDVLKNRHTGQRSSGLYYSQVKALIKRAREYEQKLDTWHFGVY